MATRNREERRSLGPVPATLLGCAAGGLLFVLQQAPVRTWIIAAALLLTGACFAAAIWQFSARAVEQYRGKQLARVLTRTTTTGFCVMFALLSASFISGWRQDQECERFRSIVTGGGFPGATTFSVLSNSELRERALTIASVMRDRANHYQDAVDVVKGRERSGIQTYAQADQQINDIRKQCGREFQATIRSNMELTLRELRNRIPGAQRRDIPTLPGIKSVDPGGDSLDLGVVVPSEFCLSLMPLRAQELEKLAKLLPE